MQINKEDRKADDYKELTNQCTAAQTELSSYPLPEDSSDHNVAIAYILDQPMVGWPVHVMSTLIASQIPCHQL